MIRDEAFIDLEQSLAKELLPRWGLLNKRIVAKIVPAIEDNDFIAVSEALDLIKVSTLYRGKIKRVRMLLKTGLLFGASRINYSAENLAIVDSKKDMDMVNVAEKQFRLQMQAMMLTVQKQLMLKAVKLRERLDWEAQNADRYFTEKSEVHVQKVNPINLRDAATITGDSIGRGMINMASSLQMSRMAGYGFAAEASARGVTEYKINEQMDSATCPVCSRMNGKVFQVKDAYAKLDSLIRITDPNDLKLLAPWPKQTKEGIEELEEMTTEELRAKGYDTPPFHPRCRGLLAVNKEKKRKPSVPLVPEYARPLTDVESIALYDELLGYGMVNNGADGVKAGLADGLVPVEATVLHEYTRSLYRDFNAWVRSPSSSDFSAKEDFYKKAERSLNNALEKLPAHKGDAVREMTSVDIPPEYWEKVFTKNAVLGREVNGFMSTSYELSDFQYGKKSSREKSLVTIELINTKTGRNITKYSRYGDAEKEVLFPTTSKFKVLDAISDGKGSLKVTLEEI